MSTAFSTAYPAERGTLARVFFPLVEPRAYLRFIHLALMMPLGIAYFTFFVTAFSFGGSLIWTFVGPPVLFVAMYISLRLGDLEVWLVNLVTRAEIRRPQQALEDVTSFRQKVWARFIDPSTWTGLVYEFAQFPIGIAALIGVVTGLGVSAYLMISPILLLFFDSPIKFGENTGLVFETPVEALPLVPLGLLGWLLSVHILTVFSAIHAGWARLMLGSRAHHLPAPLEPPAADPKSGPPPPPPPLALLPPPAVVEQAEEVLAGEAESDPRRDPAGDDPAVETLTAREREVTLLLARGYSNADISEHCYISEGTVKTHVLHILEKLNLRDRTQVVIFAYEHGLVQPGALLSYLDREAVGAR